ncbi:uncharacterized protein LOC132273854 [Cornus florida]|uniref:uncharacterized protein LOC132273854 n=1 Tax=Cornus florida TaxID=4283 RepID=UPI00289C5232|nr:uncharacterized protein LOC132273854 [Cornus florida]
MDEKGSVIRNKARLVCKGYSQQVGIDYDETFAPVARMESIKMLLSFAYHKQVKVYQMDVKSAFLNGDLNEKFLILQIYVDDIMVCGPDTSLASEFANLKKTTFEMSLLGTLRYFLGLQITQTSTGFFISQSIIGSLLYLTASRPDIMYLPSQMLIGVDLYLTEKVHLVAVMLLVPM